MPDASDKPTPRDDTSATNDRWSDTWGRMHATVRLPMMVRADDYTLEKLQELTDAVRTLCRALEAEREYYKHRQAQAVKRSLAVPPAGWSDDGR